MVRQQISGLLLNQDMSRIAWKGGLLEHFWVSQRAQWVKAVVSKPDTLCSNPGPHGRRKELLCVVLWLLHMCHGVSLLTLSLCLPVSLTHTIKCQKWESSQIHIFRKFSNLIVYKFIKHQNLHLNVSCVNSTAKKNVICLKLFYVGLVNLIEPLISWIHSRAP